MELDIAVEAVLGANAAVYAVMRRLVRRCDAMLGHSTGEHSAAMAAGALDVETDERLAAFCHGLYASYADAAERHDVPSAVLLALGCDAASAERIAAQAGGELYLAMDNCPHQTVLVGDGAAASRAREIAVGEGLMCQELPYDRAVHTPLFAPFAEDLRATFARIPVRSADTPLWSCTTAAPYPQDPAAIRELLVEHWTRPVRFRETIEALHDDGARVFLEVGPRGNMTSFMQDILRGRPACAAAADLPRRSGTAQLNHVVGMLCVHDVELDFDYLFARRDARVLDWRNPEPQTKARSHRVPLGTAWPMLRLSQDAIERVRPSPGAGGPSPTAPSESGPAYEQAPLSVPAPVPAVAVAAAGAPSVSAPALTLVHSSDAAPNGLRSVEPAPVAAREGVLVPMPERVLSVPAAVASISEAIGGAPDEIAYAIDGFLETMEQFLSANEEVMGAYLGAGATAVVEQPHRPLVGTIVSFEPGLEPLPRRVVDPLQDHYLLDHTLGRNVSRNDAGLHALALMPLAMSIEILAEAASCLLGDKTVTGVRDLRAHRWIAFEQGPQTLEVGSAGCLRAMAASWCAWSSSTSTRATWRGSRSWRRR